MQNAFPVRVEQLEDRVTPAVFGTPWPDGGHVSLSFAPDGTLIAGTGSELVGRLDQLGPRAPLDVLRAFQAWVVNANVNIGLVSDSGAAFGTGGSVQGDPRFGDIRIGGRVLAPDVLAVTAPYALYDNYSGDVVLNTAAAFENLDLFTVFLQEAGHSLGVGNSLDPSSAMYEYYQGVRCGLSAGDVAAIRSLYGVRQGDQFEGSTGNGTLPTATRYAAGLLGLGGSVAADITAPDDVDVYKLTTGLLTRNVILRLKASGLSLLTAKVEILDSAGRVLASATATDPTDNDLTVTLGGRGLATYYVRVSGWQGDVFGVGSYQLDVTQTSLVGTIVGAAEGLLEETGLNDTLAAATHLLTGALAVGPQTEYHARASFGAPSDVDSYRIAVLGTSVNQPANMLVTVWGSNGATLNPWVEVYDSLGRKVVAEVLTADGNTTTIQVRGVAAGGVYFIKTFSDTRSTGSYDLAADLRAAPIAVPPLASGTLTADAPEASADFAMPQTGQAHFVLSVDGAEGVVELVVTDADGRVVARVTAVAGRGRSVDVFLAAGAYRVTTRTTCGSPVVYQVGAAIVTDPVGAKPTDPTTDPQRPAPPPTDTSLPPHPPPAPPPPQEQLPPEPNP
jgi:hypothetical protein